MSQKLNKPVVLFDGVCNFCNKSVIYVSKIDKRRKIFFASLQSECGKEILNKMNVKIKEDEYESVIFIRDEKLYKKSRAVLEILRESGGIWKFFYVFRIIPSFISDFFYDLIAKNRYRLFGKKESCMIPSAEIKRQFLC
jgi:predicted DCC family thiol-disulfide oxidoreductase YuxK